MPQRSPKSDPASPADPSRLPVWLIGGEDDFLVAETARQRIRAFLDRDDEHGPELEILRADGPGTADVLDLLKRLEEALLTRSLFAVRKIVWLQDCRALVRAERPKSPQVLDAWKRLAERVRRGNWPPDTALVVSGPPPDGALAFVKSVQAKGFLIAVGGTGHQARADGGPDAVLASRLRKAGKRISPAAQRLFLAAVGDDTRRIAAETEKLIDFAGENPVIDEDAVRDIASPGVEPPLWDLADAFGERRLDDALRLVGRFLDRGETPMSLLMGLVQRVRLMIALQGLVAEDLLRPDESYPRFKTRAESLPDEVRNLFPTDRRLNPLAQHPFVLYKVAGQAAAFDGDDLERAMHILVAANRRLVSGGAGQDRLVLQTALVRILRRPRARAR